MVIDKPIGVDGEEANSYSEVNLKNVFKLYIILIAVFLGMLIAGVLVFTFMHINTDKIQSGVFIKDINVSGLTKDQAKYLVTESLKNDSNDQIILNYKNCDYYVSLEQIEATFDVDSAVNFAYDIGRSDNLLDNLYSYIKLLEKDVNIEPNLIYNDDALTKYLEDIEKKLPDQLVESSYYIEDGKLIITNGRNGAGINIDEMKQQIVSALQDLSYKDSSFEISTYVKTPEKIDIEKIHNEIYKQEKNAYYTTEPYMLYNHVVGVDFENSVQDIQNMIDTEEKEEYVIALKYTYPEVTINDIGIEAFPDMLATFSTDYVASNTNRTTNLKLAADKIDGTVLMPGDVFSYNKVVGKRTEEAGFKNAAIYSDGQVVDGLGGGICQISTTLYDAVVKANLEIVDRTNHMFKTSYVPAGHDATVVYGSIDFKFKNSRDYPIKIISDVSGGVATVSIYGLAEEADYDDIVIESRIIRSIPYSTQYQTNRKYRSGTIIQSGANGYVVEAYKVYKLNGYEVRRELLSKDTYSPMNKIIAN